MKKVLIIIVIFAVIGVILGFVYAAPKSHQHGLTPSAQPTRSPVATPIPTASQPGIPQTISIPSLNVSQVPVEQVGKDNQGRMAVPTNWYDTGWYEYGPRPGEQGNAVIDGHLDTPSGAASVFWNLKNMQPGDTINVTDSNGKTFTFAVTRVTSYPLDDFPIQEVFGSSSSTNLNLITCGGTWDAANHIYNQRVVVYSQLQK